MLLNRKTAPQKRLLTRYSKFSSQYEESNPTLFDLLFWNNLLLYFIVYEIKNNTSPTTFMDGNKTMQTRLITSFIKIFSNIYYIIYILHIGDRLSANRG